MIKRRRRAEPANPEPTRSGAGDALVSRWESIYGHFLRPEDITAEPIRGLDKESGWIHRFIVEFVDRLRTHASITPVLLAGEPARVVSHYESWLGLKRDEFTTAGLEDVDVEWNYENDPPRAMGTFRLVLSQAMFEHLIDPYRHLCDLYGLLEPGGSLIVMTHLPGFGYHRHPIDAVRFFPDWFETVAVRLGADVTGRLVGDDRIVYQLTRPIQP